MLLKQWLKALKKDNWQPSTASRVCSLHFQLCDFIDTPGIKRKILKSNIVPSINLGYKETENDLLSNLHEVIEERKYNINLTKYLNNWKLIVGLYILYKVIHTHIYIIYICVCV